MARERLMSRCLNLLQDNYVLPRFGQVMQAAGKVKRKFAMKALPEGWLSCFRLHDLITLINRFNA